MRIARGLSASGLQVALAIAYYGWTGWPGNDKLKVVMGLSKSALKRGIRNCIASGILRYDYQFDGAALLGLSAKRQIIEEELL